MRSGIPCPESPRANRPSCVASGRQNARSARLGRIVTATETMIDQTKQPGVK